MPAVEYASDQPGGAPYRLADPDAVAAAGPQRRKPASGFKARSDDVGGRHFVAHRSREFEQLFQWLVLISERTSLDQLAPRGFEFPFQAGVLRSSEEVVA